MSGSFVAGIADIFFQDKPSHPIMPQWDWTALAARAPLVVYSTGWSAIRGKDIYSRSRWMRKQQNSFCASAVRSPMGRSRERNERICFPPS